MKNVTLIYPTRDQMAGTLWDFRHLLRLMKEKAGVIALSTFVCIALAVVYLMLAPRIYSSRAVIYVEQRDKTVVDIKAVDPEDLEAMEVMKTVEQSISTDEMMLRVIKANHLASVPEFGGGDPNNPPTDDQLIKALNGRVSIKVRRGTRLIDIIATSKDPRLAQAIAQSFVDEYLRLDMEQRAGTANMANGFLLREADHLKANLEVSAHALQTYREQHDALSLNETQNIVVDSLKDLNGRLGQARADRMKLEADYNQYKMIGDSNPRALLAIPTIAASQSVQNAERAVDDQRSEIAELSRRYRAEHPKYIQAESRLAQVEDDYNKTILTVANGMQTAYQAALDNEKKISDALAAQEQASSDLNKIAIPYETLQHNVDADRELYQSVITRLKETDVTKMIDDNPIRLIETPRVTSKPVSPKIPLVLAASILLGIGTGLSISLLMHSMDTSFRSVEEVEQTLHIPIIAAVPRLKKSKAAGLWPGMPMVSEPYSVTAEAFRSLRTVLDLKDETDKQILLITSAIPDEGKTFCSTNAAVALAQQGYRTLIIDTDLRNPSVDAALHIPPRTPGLTDYLSGATTFAQSTQVTDIPGLTAITAGSGANSPSELLSGDRLARLFSDPAIAAFDRIILDTPPINAVSDALNLVKYATSTCLVVRAGSTPAKAAIRAHAALIGARVLDAGIILNCVPTMEYYTYGSSNAYGKPPELAKA
jgi:capsular exopolysaccharide synthesis family protein